MDAMGHWTSVGGVGEDVESEEGIASDGASTEEEEGFFRVEVSICIDSLEAAALGEDPEEALRAARRGERLLSTGEIEAIFVTWDKTAGTTEVSYSSATSEDTCEKGGE